MFKKLAVFTALAFLSPLAAARASEAPPPPPELKKTVEAFAGNWLFDATVTLPGGAPTKLKMKLDCQKTALGKGVACAGSASIPGMGPWQGTFMVGYDTFGKQVHFMSLTSDEEVHDHRCTWKSESNLDCEPLKGGLGGQAVTEEVSFVAGPRTLSFKSVSTMKDGRVTFEGTARRK